MRCGCGRRGGDSELNARRQREVAALEQDALTGGRAVEAEHHLITVHGSARLDLDLPSARGIRGRAPHRGRADVSTTCPRVSPEPYARYGSAACADAARGAPTLTTTPSAAITSTMSNRDPSAMRVASVPSESSRLLDDSSASRRRTTCASTRDRGAALPQLAPSTLVRVRHSLTRWTPPLPTTSARWRWASCRP